MRRYADSAARSGDAAYPRLPRSLPLWPDREMRGCVLGRQGVGLDGASRQDSVPWQGRSRRVKQCVVETARHAVTRVRRVRG
jgi:hypothetical protein